MYERLYNLWFVDQRTRRRLYAWSIAAAFAYGVTNGLLLGRPESQVTWETLGLVCVIFSVSTVFYCTRTAVTRQKKVGSDRGVLVGVAIGVAVVAIVSVYVLGGPQSFMYMYTPSKSAGSELLDIRAALQTAEAQGTILPPPQIASYKATLRAMSPAVGEYWTTVAAIINYQSLVNQKNREAPDPTTVAKPCLGENSRNNRFGDMSFPECMVVLDNEQFDHVLFRDSVIIYHGGPVTLVDAKFVNCRFVLDLTDQHKIPVQKDLLLTLLASPNQKDVKISRSIS